MSRSGSFGNFIGGVAIGGGLMYLLDPDSGNRRRMLLRDKIIHGVNVSGRAATRNIRHLQNRARGSVVEVWSSVRGEPVPDGILVERVRSRIGRVVSHPGAINVRAQSGQVILEGHVLENEVDRLIAEIGVVRGVRGVDNRLESHREAGNIPGLQSGERIASSF